MHTYSRKLAARFLKPASTTRKGGTSGPKTCEHAPQSSALCVSSHLRRTGGCALGTSAGVHLALRPEPLRRQLLCALALDVGERQPHGRHARRVQPLVPINGRKVNAAAATPAARHDATETWDFDRHDDGQGQGEGKDKRVAWNARTAGSP
eukprot:2040322-Pleurochrysis_carterae.AAC.2